MGENTGLRTLPTAVHLFEGLYVYRVSVVAAQTSINLLLPVVYKELFPLVLLIWSSQLLHFLVHILIGDILPILHEPYWQIFKNWV